MNADFSNKKQKSSTPTYHIKLHITGMKCGACAAKVKGSLLQNGAMNVQVDLLSGIVSIESKHPSNEIESKWISLISSLGYKATPLQSRSDDQEEEQESSTLLRYCLASGLVTGFTLLLSLAGIKAPWFIAALSITTVLYAAQPFFFSALRVLRYGHSNMDVPISAALILTMAMSLFELIRGGAYTYFDSAIMLTFILLIGRTLDQKTRGKAREAAGKLLSLFANTARIIKNGAIKEIPSHDLLPDMVLSVAAGEKIAADGIITQGQSSIDAAMITGETLPQDVHVGSPVFAGTVNLSAPIQVQVKATSENSLLSEMIQLMQKAQQGHARFVRLADRVASLYTPIVFALSAFAFLLWFFVLGTAWQEALMIATTVMIITCPCAMALAVPAVQILASASLFKNGLLLKSADALEKLSIIDTIVFDKTGTLTLGKPTLSNRSDISDDVLKIAASLASHSRHPLAKAVCTAYGEGPLYTLEHLTEKPGQGLQAILNDQTVRLGRREWCGLTSSPKDDVMEMWLRIGADQAIRFIFQDALRPDTREVIFDLKKRNLSIILLSGDRASVVESVARKTGIDQAQGQLSPTEKCHIISDLRKQKHRILMVGDGLNDAAALATAHVSLSPSSAMDITQNAADIVFQGKSLSSVLIAIETANKAQTLVYQNIGLSVLYNFCAVPLAVFGLVTPMIAAAAMSLSSLIVVMNAQRMRTPSSH